MTLTLIFSDLGDLVLVKVKGIFYRGRVFELIENNLNSQLGIFFVDYGSITMVHCKDIFQWHPLWDTTPGEIILIVFFFKFD